MTSAVTGRSLEFGTEDYDAIERAVMETRRGRWFLDQRDKRQRMGDIQRILDALKKLEGALAALPAQSAPVNGTDVLRAIAAPRPALDDNMAREPGSAELPMPAASSAETAAQALSMKNMKYFKQDEAIFASCVPVAPKLAGVEAARPAEAPPAASGAHLAVNHVSPAAAEAPAAAAAPTVDVKPAELEIPPPPVPAAAESGDKRRIVIIRRAATEPMEIPLQAELAASPAP